MKIGKLEEPSTGRTLSNGDIIYYNFAIGAWDILPIGTNGQTLTMAYPTLLCHFDGTTGDKPDAESGQTITYISTAAVSSVQKKFGTASLLLDGDSDYITIPDSDDWNLGADNFTIEFWVRWNDITTGFQGYQGIISNYSSPTGWSIRKKDTHNIQCVLNGIGGGGLNSTGTVEDDVWYHMALVRNGSSIKFYINGVMDTQVTTYDTITDGANTLRIGDDGQGAYFLNGWVDEVRISKGIARWTSNFTPPVEAYSFNPEWRT
jgi:hypothetical protein